MAKEQRPTVLETPQTTNRELFLRNTQWSSFFFAATIFLSAFLLFSVEPLLAKKILPWFGGSAAVWSTCLVLYQVALLIGYLYARLLTLHAPPRMQAVVHIALLSVSLLLLPIGPSERWKPNVLQDPTWLILGMLIATVGLPFAVLSSTSPLLQDWLARSGHKTPYRLFALSNFASLAALLSYPIVIEPAFNIQTQALIWSVLYVVFGCLCGTVAWQSRTKGFHSQKQLAAVERSLLTQKSYWFALSACGSMLLLSVTNHLTKNVAPVPLLWVLPLAIYLLTFILAFRGQNVYSPVAWRRWLIVALLALGYAVHNIWFSERLLLPIFLLGLFVCCLFCHGELSRLRPEAQNLTEFYLILSLGGATGAIFVGLVAPHVFSGIYELPLSLVLTGVLATMLTWRDGAWSTRLLWIGVAGCMLVVFKANVAAYHENTLSMQRSFYGSLRVVQPPDQSEQQHRILFHGTVEHGVQFLSSALSSRATTYYGPDSGVGILLRECFTGPKRVGLVGLGVGTLATYGKPGDTFRFYELNPQVIDIARSQFTFLRDSQAHVSTVEGDARLSLEHENEPPYDVLVLDAFSGDAVPVHLLTREALALYHKRLQPEGVLAFHLTNRYLDLPPVVRQLAEEIGYRAVLVKNRNNQKDLVLASSWVLVTKNKAVLENSTIRAHAEPIKVHAGLRPWTDQYNNLFQVLKTRQ